MSDGSVIRGWWRAAEGAAGAEFPQRLPAFAAGLADAHAHELAFRVSEAQKSLELAAEAKADPAFAPVHRLLQLRIRLRDSADPRLIIDPVTEFLQQPGVDLATQARGWHLLGIAHLRLAQYPQAERALAHALKLIDDDPSRIWIIDGFAQVFMGQGAWEECRRTLAAVSRKKAQLADHTGLAITAGHLAMMEIRLGRPQTAREAVKDALALAGRHLAPHSLMRLQTLLLEACLALEDREGGSHAAEALKEMIASDPADRHYLRGFACVALARASATAPAAADRSSMDSPRSAPDRSAADWLRAAAECFTLPGQLALLRYWEAKLAPGAIDRSGWWEEIQALFRRAPGVTDAEVLIHLHLAERAMVKGDRDAMRTHLQTAFDRAARSNNRLLVEQVDQTYGEFDPRGLSERVVERFSGRTLKELNRTLKEDATIIFADLVNFTPRSAALDPDEVMTTVRSLFELASPLFAEHHVRPISYLGDGLLAAAEGANHQAHGVRFAHDLVRRARRVSRVRMALGETWGLEMRAGVASGPVVMGVLGSHFKLDFAAIGLTTNLAARLQGAATPNQVMVAIETARHAGIAQSHETLSLKGLDNAVEAVRLEVDN